MDIHAKRLLNVAVALLDAASSIKDGEKSCFTMKSYFNECGTPACALGHYATRTDLQEAFHQGPIEDRWVYLAGTTEFLTDYYCAPVQYHFGITKVQARMLFSGGGCGGANTELEAVKYIKWFVSEHHRYLLATEIDDYIDSRRRK